MRGGSPCATAYWSESLRLVPRYQVPRFRRPSGGDAWTFVGYVTDVYRDGRNEVVLYEVERVGSTVVLHPLSRGS